MRLLVQLNAAYVAQHGVVALALILLLFAHLAELPRIRTIVVTLAASVGPVLEFCAVMVPMVLCLAVSGGLTVGGPRCGRLQLWPQALHSAFALARCAS